MFSIIKNLLLGKKGDPSIPTKIINTLRHPGKFILARCEDVVYNIKNRQRKQNLGLENPDKKFYVIGFNCGWNGLGWIIIHITEHLEYAEKKGYIPVIDLKNFRSQYVSAENSGKENVWEYWFEQPEEYNLQDILKSKYVIKSRCAISPNRKCKIRYFDYKNEERVKKLRSIYNKRIKINETIKKRISEIQNRLIGDKRVLGIMCRGTDFTMLKPYLHPVQPNPQDIINEAEIVMKKRNCSHIFLATEDTDIHDLFREKFGDIVLSVPQIRFTEKDLGAKGSLSDLSDSENRREIAFSYLASMYILSKCPCFISGITGGSLVVKIMSGGFEYEHFWDLGIYTCNDESLGEYWKHFCEELAGKRVRK
jgi:hypothetical protein